MADDRRDKKQREQLIRLFTSIYGCAPSSPQELDEWIASPEGRACIEEAQKQEDE